MRRAALTHSTHALTWASLQDVPRAWLLPHEGMLCLSTLVPRQADNRRTYTTNLQVLLMQEGIQAGLCDQLPICRVLTHLYLVTSSSILGSWSTPILPDLLRESSIWRGCIIA